ncbi:NDP-hexose 2,3-dehydratase family protein [Maridesulfovibrio sp.]|uniref:NDP-hexose 2,3-dehydratase family protein n=1 Tax=Maridesulfovibrio sp. TaxID=2795000 RepID=UPI0039F08763
MNSAKTFAFLKSELTTDGIHSLDEFWDWYNARLEEGSFEVTEIPFKTLGQWEFKNPSLYLGHDSGKFFTIEGLEVETDFGEIRKWDQPIINQPEIGILGILTKEINGVLHFLMQAKMEPGNINTLQISPTVQATKSNYTKVHKGRTPTYLEYFIDADQSEIMIDSLQSEQGARFLAKRNRNILIKVEGDVAEHEDFFWLTLGQIKEILKFDNIINMDARTVLSCIPYFTAEDIYSFNSLDNTIAANLEGYPKKLISSMSTPSPLNDLDEIISWITSLKSSIDFEVKRKPLDMLKQWSVGEEEIVHDQNRYFSVIAVDVKAGSREVVSWSQPLLKHYGIGLCGFISQEIDGVLHFLTCARIEPGNRDILEIGPTVAKSGEAGRSNYPEVKFSKYFTGHARAKVIFDAVHSEEGGRFYHFQNRYVIVEVDSTEKFNLPKNYKWMTLAQISELIKFSQVNIEARNLLACLNLSQE